MGNRRRQGWATLALGLVLGAVGLTCLGGGIALIVWRLAEPDRALLVPAALVQTPEDTPTPGLLGTPLAPPPLPDDPQRIVMLPESEDPTATPLTPDLMSPTLTGTVQPSDVTRTSPSSTHTPLPASGTPTTVRTPTPTDSPTATPTALSASPTGVIPSATLAASATAIAPTATPPTPVFLPAPKSSVPDHITVAVIGLDAPIVPVDLHPITIENMIYSQWDVPNQRAAGWHDSSAPLGKPGNTVLNGHHNIYGEVFRWLVALKPGNVITLESGTRRYYYVVVQTMTLAEEGQPLAKRQENARWILPTDDERVTLITCWPYYARSHRLIVIARPLWDVVAPGDIP